MPTKTVDRDKYLIWSLFCCAENLKLRSIVCMKVHPSAQVRFIDTQNKYHSKFHRLLKPIIFSCFAWMRWFTGQRAQSKSIFIFINFQHPIDNGPLESIWKSIDFEHISQKYWWKCEWSGNSIELHIRLEVGIDLFELLEFYKNIVAFAVARPSAFQ